jgi:hypothetical protein
VRWSAFTEMSPEDMYQVVADGVFPIPTPNLLTKAYSQVSYLSPIFGIHTEAVTPQPDRSVQIRARDLDRLFTRAENTYELFHSCRVSG